MMQVAVANKHQNSGIGRELVAHAEKRAKASGYKKLIMHAMLNVVGFWEKLGYTQEGDIFEEKGITFAKMSKEI
jgi:ribosomal protein S18 acetylase RimI-like enzyme